MRFLTTRARAPLPYNYSSGIRLNGGRSLAACDFIRLKI